MSKIKFYSSFGDVEVQSKRAEVMVSALNDLAKSGKFFSVEFEKKDGTIRKMTARTQVTKGLAGGVRTLPAKYLCVYDVQKQAYRSINPETILKINSVEV